MNVKTLTFDEFLPMLATITRNQDPGSYDDFVEVKQLKEVCIYKCRARVCVFSIKKETEL